eukprot:80496-Amphidinium_carterae.2
MHLLLWKPWTASPKAARCCENVRATCYSHNKVFSDIYNHSGLTTKIYLETASTSYLYMEPHPQPLPRTFGKIVPNKATVARKL